MTPQFGGVIARKNMFEKKTEDAAFIDAYNSIQEKAFGISLEKGFYPDGNEDSLPFFCMHLAMIHGEISEALEAVRLGNKNDDKLPDFSAVEVELADAVIRIMGIAGYKNLRVAEAIIEKIKYNSTRKPLHGKLF